MGVSKIHNQHMGIWWVLVRFTTNTMTFVYICHGLSEKSLSNGFYGMWIGIYRDIWYIKLNTSDLGLSEIGG